MLTDHIVIRPYRPSDRDAVRRICYETAHRGGSMRDILEDREILADCVTQYYTDLEPQAVWVAESSDRVVGYLTGCLDSRRYARLMWWRVAPLACFKAILRGVLRSRTTWGMLRAGLATLRRGGWRRRVPLSRYPAHFHIDLDPAFRRQKIGAQLVARFCEQARAAGLAGIHVAVNGENAPARRFFERQGFQLFSEHPAVIWDGRSQHLGRTCLYGKTL